MSAALLLALGAFGAAAGCGILGWRRVSAAACLLGAMAVGGVGIAGLAGRRLGAVVPLGLPPFSLTWHLDPLAGFFLVLLSLAGGAAAAYGGAYLAHAARDRVRWVSTLLPLFLASMALVLLAAGAVAFLLAWECMSLTSYALVMTDGERRETVDAGFVYLVMTHAGGLALLAAFFLLAHATGSLQFAAWAAAAPHLSGPLRAVVFLLLLAAFGGKAALVPLHVWLPRAHPVAPSHISGLMSGVMLKVAVYGLVLFAFRLLGPGPWWWGAALLGAGLASALLGVLYAAVERDLKRLLAYSSVENVGIVAMALGTALLARSQGLAAVAVVALVAALFHTASHALFKTALFFESGSLQHAGAGRNLDAMGGILGRMPWTGTGLLLGAGAIAGLPPFSGFVGEWLTYQSLLQLARLGGRGAAVLAFAGVLGLALAGGLAVATFVKAAGGALMGSPRSAAVVREVPVGMILPPLLLVGACLVLGLAPAALTAPLASVAAGVLGNRAGLGTLLGPHSALALALPWTAARLAPVLFTAVAAAGAIAAAAAVRLSRVHRPQPAVREAWGCGAAPDAGTPYTATAYAKPFRLVFGTLYRPVRSLEVQHGGHPFFRTRIAYRGDITLVLDRFLYRPLVRALLALAGAARRLQSGSLRLYLGYMLAALVLLLALAR